MSIFVQHAPFLTWGSVPRLTTEMLSVLARTDLPGTSGCREETLGRCWRRGGVRTALGSHETAGGKQK